MVTYHKNCNISDLLGAEWKYKYTNDPYIIASLLHNTQLLKLHCYYAPTTGGGALSNAVNRPFCLR